jgi:hypothetical protein
MHIKYFITTFCLAMSLTLTAQTSNPLGEYEELTDNATVDVSGWTTLKNQLYMSWASKDVHYVKQEVPAIKIKSDTTVYAWRGERVGVEALLFSPVATGKISLRLTDWTKDNITVDASHGEARFINYVLADEFKSCGTNPRTSTTHLIPDCIDIDAPKALAAKTTRPVWCSLEVPRDLEAGTYKLTLQVTDSASGKQLGTLGLRVVVRDHTLPLPADQQFFLNLWMQPYSVSRYYNVARWSQAHFDAMRPYMERLARAGECVATAILFYEPWGDQSYDKFDPMIQTTKNSDGTWSYDYTIFDKWIAYLDTIGINKQINCFSMVPWDMSFRYYDEATSAYKSLKTTTSSVDYRNLWNSFLTSFAKHLKEKGWYDKTCIAMDERGLSNMQDAYKVLQNAVPGMKMSLAGNYHSELATKLYDYCVALDQKFTTNERAARLTLKWPTTMYVSCADVAPNIFTNSDPAEATYLPFYAISNGFDGFLHWSYMNWGADPLRDARYRLFSPGDTYCIYPGNRSSVRFERLIEGIEATEKLHIMRQQYTTDGDTAALSALNKALADFATSNVSTYYPASDKVNVMESLLNEAPLPVADRPTDYCTVMLDATNRDVAIQKRWLASATTTGCTTNLQYTATTQSSTGVVIAPTTIEVHQGDTFKFTVVPTTNDDDIRYCRVALFADWNNDSIFDVKSNELVARVGAANVANNQLLNYTFTVKVPDNAVPGLTRIRLCYADAWKDLPMPCGALYKGFAFELPTRILPKATSVGSVRAADAYRWYNGKLQLGEPARLTVFTLSGACVDQTNGVTAYDTHDFTKGDYIISVRPYQGRAFGIKFTKSE